MLAPYLLSFVIAAGVVLFGSAIGIEQSIEQSVNLEQTLRLAPQLALLASIL